MAFRHPAAAACLAALMLTAAGTLLARDESRTRISSPQAAAFRPFSLCPAAPEPRAAADADSAFIAYRSPYDGGFEAALSQPALHPKKHRGRAWLEWGGFMTYSGVSYWIKYTKAGFIEDWQFKLNWHDQSRRFFTLEAWQFDSNNFKLNWTHSFAGGIYYNFSRTNNLSWLQSWLMGIAGSFLWEYVVEWKEVVSINDQIMTGLGSYSTGEPWYQFGRFLSNQPSIVMRALSFLNPIEKINHWLDRKDPAASNYEQPGWHDTSLFAGGRWFGKAGQDTQAGVYFGFHGRLITLPEYGRPGDIREKINDTFFSEISLDYSVRDGHSDETNLLTNAVPWGIFRQTINDAHEGSSLMFGLGSSFEYMKKRPVFYYDSSPVPVNQGVDLHLEEPRNFTDKQATLHLAGPVLDWTLFRRGLKLRTVAAAYLDFSLVNSLALNEYSALHDIAGMKTTVLYYGYYYGFGTTLSGHADLEWGNFRARGLLSFGAWGSADFRDRFQAQVTNNAHLKDTRTRYLIGTGWRIPRLPIEIFVNYEGIARWGRIQEVNVHGLEKRFFAGLEFFY